MDNVNFTPGPWEASRSCSPDNTGGYDYAIVAGGKVIGEAFEHVGYAEGGQGYDTRPAHANARLIAAAPALYEALAEAIEALAMCEPRTAHGANCQNSAMLKARAALSLARVESNRD